MSDDSCRLIITRNAPAIPCTCRPTSVLDAVLRECKGVEETTSDTFLKVLHKAGGRPRDLFQILAMVHPGDDHLPKLGLRGWRGEARYRETIVITIYIQLEQKYPHLKFNISYLDFEVYSHTLGNISSYAILRRFPWFCCEV
jgi:hypothetical protein